MKKVNCLIVTLVLGIAISTAFAGGGTELVQGNGAKTKSLVRDMIKVSGELPKPGDSVRIVSVINRESLYQQVVVWEYENPATTKDEGVRVIVTTNGHFAGISSEDDNGVFAVQKDGDTKIAFRRVVASEK